MQQAVGVRRKEHDKETRNPAAPKTLPLENAFFCARNPLWTLNAAVIRIGNRQSSHAPSVNNGTMLAVAGDRDPPRPRARDGARDRRSTDPGLRARRWAKLGDFQRTVRLHDSICISYNTSIIQYSYLLRVQQFLPGYTGSMYSFHPIYYLRPSCSSPSYEYIVVTQILGHIVDPSLPSPHYGTCLDFLSGEGFGTFFPRRFASNCAYPRYIVSRRSGQ